MEPEQTPEMQKLATKPKQSFWNTVTPFSKYLAMVLFIILPFVGGWVGYMFAPEKIVEIERTVVIEKTESNGLVENWSLREKLSLPIETSDNVESSGAPSSHIGNCFSIVDGQVYFGWGFSDELIKGADVETFEVLNDCVEKDAWPPAISKDINNVYLKSEQIPGADPATFKFIFGPGQYDQKYKYFASDKEHVYYEGEQILGADPESFKIIFFFRGLSHDKQRVYMHGLGTEIIDMDGESFRILNNGYGNIPVGEANYFDYDWDIKFSHFYATDSNKVAMFTIASEAGGLYFKLIEEADPETFVFVEDNENFDAKDVNYFYLKGERVTIE